MIKLQSDKYYKKIVQIHTMITYIIIVLMCVIGYAFVLTYEVQTSNIIKSGVFRESVDAYEDTFEMFSVVTEQLKEENNVVLFTLGSENEERLNKISNNLQQKLIQLSETYQKQGLEILVYRDDIDLIIGKNGEFTLEQLIEKQKIQLRDIHAIIEYLNYSTETDFSIISDEKILFITQNNIGSKNVFIIVYKNINEIYINKGKVEEFFFWENAQNVIDIREIEVIKNIDNPNFFYMPSTMKGEVILNETEDFEYRLYKSSYFDIIYCSVSQKNTMEVIIKNLLVVLMFLIALYFIIYYITDKITRIIYQPIENIFDYIEEVADVKKTKYRDILDVMAYIEDMTERNIHYKIQLQKAQQQLLGDRKLEQEIIKTEQIKEFDKIIESDEQIKEKLRQYIIEHISEDISLSDLSEYFGLSFAYMSTFFKNKMQMNFKEYVSYQRYMLSIEIMNENPKIKIVDVSNQVGIKNLNTFIRIFKKYNNSTPKQYISMLESEKNSE